ncbi:MAG: hypothetical protein ACOCSE_02645, partial [Chitinivibrionales bacterium]
MGETFTGIADNNETMYYNPAGLGQSPLANTWKKYKLPTSSSVTAVSSPARAAFDLSAVNIYAGTESGEIFLHNGHIWKDYKTYALREEDDDLRAVAKRFVNTDNDTLIRKSINKIRRFNEINLKRTAACKDIIKDHIKKDSSGKFMTDPFFLAGKIADINAGSKDTMSVYKELSSYIDTSVTDSLAGEVMSIFSIEDKVIESMLDIKIPMNVTIDEPITAIAVDASSTLWVGTNNGLWEFDEHSWSK